MLCLDKRMIGNARPDVRVQAERLAHRDVQTLETAALWRGDWRLQKNLGVAERFPRAGLNAGTVACQIDFLTNVDLFDIQLRTRFFQDVKRCLHYFRTDAIAIGDCNWN